MKVLAFVVGVGLAGLAAWNLGQRMSIDAITLAIGLIFGVLSGIPAALLVLLASRQQPRRGGYDDGFDAGIRQAQRTEMERECARLVARQSYELQYGRQLPVIDAQPAPRYTVAHPFAIAGHIEDRSG